ncbi:helicase-exonuclease AddAB subunit AddA [Brevibacillus dissolubilis]|uniref:helicase-exonuclease AddAB subunit AddA n=1 Tax=Brevibacillus dissolubilis TaxID=1844116 RepID=UPI001116102D|nr:helicase-exonuclease AddAB subunit AddA [Brevibacillus dissolubilis]
MTNPIEKPSHWTDEQWQAIIKRGNNLLVAAAAGSGKTSVLVERLIRRITDTQDPVGVDQLLVVTFTNAAAAEMRHRIGDALKKALETDPDSAHLRRQLTLLSRAAITTLHSFCLGLLRQYYYMVELDPDFRIADQMEAELLRQDILEQKFEEWYEHDEAFVALADSYIDGQDDAALAHLILRLYDFSRSHPTPNEWMQEAAEMFALDDDTPLESLKWVQSLLHSIKLELTGIESQLGKAALLAGSPEGPNGYVPLLEKERDAVTQAAQACDRGFDALADAMKAISFGRLPAAKDVDVATKEQCQDLRNGAKDKINKLMEDYFASDSDAYHRDLRQTAFYMKTLVRLVIEFGDTFHKEKMERALVDFSDLEHLALRILVVTNEDGTLQPSPIAQGLREQFAEVLVDEYQDINLVQETLLQMVSRDGLGDVPANRFMVGDVKQSIYRFRLAEPNLFMEKYRTYQREEELDPWTAEQIASGELPQPVGERIDLAANFRSRKEVVDAVNFLFRQIMSEGVGEINYDRSAELICRASYPEIEPEQLDVEVHLINRRAPELEAGEGEDSYDSDSEITSSGGTSLTDERQLAEEATAAQLEARLIASRIRKWMEPGVGGKPLLVYDKQEGGMRPLKYKDIVILLRATAGWGPTMADEFKKAGIPIYVEQTDGYFSATEVDVMLSLLRVIDNPKQDIPLAAVLRSPLYRLSETELAAIRIHSPGSPFYQAVQLYHEAHREQTREQLVRKLNHFYHNLAEWRTRARRGSLAELISQIYRETSYVDYVATLENGQQRQANLRALYDKARQYEATTYRGLFRFLRFIDRLQEQQSDFGEARTMGESEDVVRLMTIHKSKGLEFPVVFVAGMGKQFNTSDTKARFLLHKDLGFGPQVVDTDLRLRYPSLAYLGIRQQLKREMLAEEMRVLYVALTRAREKLLLVGSAKDLGKSISLWSQQSGDQENLSDEDLIQAKNYLDWVGRALLRHPSGKALLAWSELEGEQLPLRRIMDESRFQYHFYQAGDLSADSADSEWDEELWKQIISRQPIEITERDYRWQPKIAEALSWQYGHVHATKAAAKWSVTDLKNMRRRSPDDAVHVEEIIRLGTTGHSEEGFSLDRSNNQITRSISEADAEVMERTNRIGQALTSGGSGMVAAPRSAISKKPRFLSVGGADTSDGQTADSVTTSPTASGKSPAASFTSAEIGTLMHLFMQHVDLSGPLDEADLREQLLRLSDREFISSEQARQIDLQPIIRFFASDLGQRMRQAKNLYRELSFTVALPADQVNPDEIGTSQLQGEQILLHGVIDCLIEDADGTLCLIDYKTDRLYGSDEEAAKELTRRYRQQISWYAIAIGQAVGRQVRNAYLYSFSRHMAVPIRL